MITSRNGENLVLRQTGLGVVNVTINTSTKIYELKGPLGLGILPSSMSPDVLEPGLKVIVEPVSAAQKQHNAIRDQAIAAGRDADAAINRRISNLADYDQKAEISILFDVNSAALSDKSKADLKDIAAKAKAFRGYLIQVAGYADSVGTANRNQALSDRRAESVIAYLQQECDVALSRVLAPVAMGASNPVAPNETAQGRAENRRATVRVAVNRGIGE